MVIETRPGVSVLPQVDNSGLFPDYETIDTPRIKVVPIPLLEEITDPATKQNVAKRFDKFHSETDTFQEERGNVLSQKHLVPNVQRGVLRMAGITWPQIDALYGVYKPDGDAEFSDDVKDLVISESKNGIGIGNTETNVMLYLSRNKKIPQYNIIPLNPVYDIKDSFITQRALDEIRQGITAIDGREIKYLKQYDISRDYKELVKNKVHAHALLNAAEYLVNYIQK